MAEIFTKEQAIEFIKPNSTLMIGGFGNVGIPRRLVSKIADMPSEIYGLTLIVNDLGTPGVGLGRLVSNKQIKKAIGSYFSYNPDAVTAYHRGELDLKLMPQGNMAEAIRAGGAGLGGFYSPVGVGTELEGSDNKVINGKEYTFVEALRADFAMIHAYKADTLGNLVYNKAAGNFNPLMAMAAKFTIAEAEEIVEAGALPPAEIATPFVYVNALVKVERGE
ncbi:MAG: CoA transferase subunit A [Acidaminococcales bacterium]|nr:CoA transferase subunit A [Acidaminococcales bacterium]